MHHTNQRSSQGSSPKWSRSIGSVLRARANVWLTAGATLFVLFMGSFFITLGDFGSLEGQQSSAALLNFSDYYNTRVAPPVNEANKITDFENRPVVSRSNFTKTLENFFSFFSKIMAPGDAQQQIASQQYANYTEGTNFNTGTNSGSQDNTTTDNGDSPGSICTGSFCDVPLPDMQGNGQPCIADGPPDLEYDPAVHGPSMWYQEPIFEGGVDTGRVRSWAPNRAGCVPTYSATATVKQGQLATFIFAAPSQEAPKYARTAGEPGGYTNFLCPEWEFDWGDDTKNASWSQCFTALKKQYMHTGTYNVVAKATWSGNNCLCNWDGVKPWTGRPYTVTLNVTIVVTPGENAVLTGTPSANGVVLTNTANAPAKIAIVAMACDKDYGDLGGPGKQLTANGKDGIFLTAGSPVSSMRELGAIFQLEKLTDWVDPRLLFGHFLAAGKLNGKLNRLVNANNSMPVTIPAGGSYAIATPGSVPYMVFGTVEGRTGNKHLWNTGRPTPPRCSGLFRTTTQLANPVK